jgi:HNH endonuclease
VGRKTRSISPALRRALNSRDGGFRFPGCTHKRFVDAHHIHHWAHGGETKPSNLVSLCRFHHRMVHEGRVRVVRCELSVDRKDHEAARADIAHNGQQRTGNSWDDGALRFSHPNGKSFDSVAPEHVRPLDWTRLPAEHEERGIHINDRTAATRWAGESMDYGLAVEVLLDRSRRARADNAANSTAL